MFIDKTASGQKNEDFYRGDDSLFVVVILSDECDDVSESLGSPAQANLKLQTFIGGPERHVVVSIAGPQAGSCNSAFGSASAAPRLHQFTALGPNGVIGNICEGDLSPSLEDALNAIQAACNTLPVPQ